MSIIVNTSAACIYAAPRGVVKSRENGKVVYSKPPGKQYAFVPGSLVSVDAADLKRLKEIPSIKKQFDTGVLVSGTAAKRVAKEVDGEIQAAEAAEAAKAGDDTESKEDLLD